MDILLKSPWYEEILKQGEIRGKKIGEALAEVQVTISSIRMGLEAKFGNQGLELMPQTSQINDLKKLQGILRTVVLANSFEEVQRTFS